GCLPQCTEGGCSPMIPTSYSDPTTNSCIFDTVKGAEAKASNIITKACNDFLTVGTNNCPECYSAAQCGSSGASNPWVQTSEGDADDPFGSQLTAFPRRIYCTETAGTLPTSDEAKCEDGLSKALAKLISAKNKCYSKCLAAQYKVGGPRSVCFGPNPVDPATD